MYDDRSEAGSVIDRGETNEAAEAGQRTAALLQRSGSAAAPDLFFGTEWVLKFERTSNADFFDVLQQATNAAMDIPAMLALGQAEEEETPTARSRGGGRKRRSSMPANGRIVSPVILHHLVCRATQLGGKEDAQWAAATADEGAAARRAQRDKTLRLRNAVLHFLHIAGEREDATRWVPPLVGPMASIDGHRFLVDIIHRLAAAILDPHCCSTARQLAVLLAEANASIYNGLLTYEFPIRDGLPTNHATPGGGPSEAAAAASADGDDFALWHDTFMGKVFRRLDDRRGAHASELWLFVQAVLVDAHSSGGLSEDEVDALKTAFDSQSAFQPSQTFNQSGGNFGVGPRSTMEGVGQRRSRSGSDEDEDGSVVVGGFDSRAPSTRASGVMNRRSVSIFEREDPEMLGANESSIHGEDDNASAVAAAARQELRTPPQTAARGQTAGQSSQLASPGTYRGTATYSDRSESAVPRPGSSFSNLRASQSAAMVAVDPAAVDYCAAGEWPLAPAVAFLGRHPTALLHETVRLLRSPGFLARRLMLRLVSTIVGSPQLWMPLSVEMLHSPAVLMSLLMCLEDRSQHIRPDAYHAVKIFIMFPNKCAPTRLLLHSNRDAIAGALTRLRFSTEDEMDQLEDEREGILRCLGAVRPLTQIESVSIAHLMRVQGAGDTPSSPGPASGSSSVNGDASTMPAA